MTFNGNIFYHSTTSGYTSLKSSAFPTPSTSYPFTFSVILTENSAGNVTVSTVYINSTAYTVNVNAPFPWNQIGYVGIRADPGNLFYVSYFGVSPAPYGGVEQFINNVESTAWKVLPIWYEGELVMNSTGASAVRGRTCCEQYWSKCWWSVHCLEIFINKQHHQRQHSRDKLSF